MYILLYMYLCINTYMFNYTYTYGINTSMYYHHTLKLPYQEID